MNRSAWRGRGAALGAVALVLAVAPSALGASKTAPMAKDGTFAAGPFAEGPSDPANLPGKTENVEVVGTFQVPGVELGQIADLAVHKGYAYLNSWDDAECEGGGTYVVDIRNPADPEPVTFIPAPEDYYHGEGAHVVSIDVPGFKGDILAVNDETYGSNVDDNGCAPDDLTGGGFDLYDVSDPANPVTLVQGFGDMDRHDDTPSTPARDFANSYHSVFVWQDGPRAYLVASDNVDFNDVDIFDITNPREPEMVGDHDLVELFGDEILAGEEGNGGSVFLHDMVVKHINGKPILKADYWDAGYVQLDVSNPAEPELEGDTTFSGEDPERPGSDLTPEGNAHQGEYSHDNQFILAADEDFGAFRNVVRATDGPTEGRAGSGAEGDAEARISELPDGTMNGPSEFVGDACDVDDVPDAPADDADPNTEDIALVERGGFLPDGTTVCGFSDKFDNVQAKGWDAIIVFNQQRPDDGTVNMATGEGGIPGIHMTRAQAIGSEGVLLDGGDPQETDTPPPGTDGPPIFVGQEFDGWGYGHLYDAETGEELDTYAIDESQDSRFADGFGDLSIHEFATDPETNLAYSAYYAGGLRVVRFSRANGIEEVGAYIAEGGSNYWGVEQFTAANGERLIAGSDRDYGMTIIRYTGPGAVGPTPAPAPGPGGRTPPPSGGGTTPPPAAKRARVRKRNITVGKNRRFSVQVNCPASSGDRCVGSLRVEKGRLNLVKKSFRVAADKFRTVSARLAKRDYRALKRKKKGQKVTITVLTRDAQGTLRRGTTKVTMRAKR